jgi:hypothetical protein
MMLSLYLLLLRAVVQTLASDMGVLQMLRHARMAVPLASLLLARRSRRSWFVWSVRPTVAWRRQPREKEFSPQRAARLKSTARWPYQSIIVI